MRDKDNYESNIEYAIYGITEPYTNKIIYIGLYVYDWNDKKEYPNTEAYIHEAIGYMQSEDNEYWRDLSNMFYNNINYNDNNKVLTGAVVLETYYEVDKESSYLNERLDYWRDIFKPRYNVNEMKYKLPPYMTVKPEDIVSSYNVMDGDISYLYCKGRVIEKEVE